MLIEYILGYIGWLWSDVMQIVIFRQMLKLMKADRAQYVWSSSDPITIRLIAMALLTYSKYNLYTQYVTRVVILEQHTLL